MHLHDSIHFHVMCILLVEEECFATVISPCGDFLPLGHELWVCIE